MAAHIDMEVCSMGDFVGGSAVDKVELQWGLEFVNIKVSFVRSISIVEFTGGSAIDKAICLERSSIGVCHGTW
jgi:hypothetical protein